MSLEYVSKGQSVRASTINSIIDAIGGNQTMSPDLEVTTTKGGQKVSMPSKYGGKLNPSDHILDQSNYMLSGWPMAQLNLGMEIQDCLGAIKVHKVDGSIDNATSAFVVYQNSSDCPMGSDLSGYLLQSGDFGQDKLVGAAGWVKTMMEDPHPGGKIQAQLWKYGEGSKLAEVFTNVPDVGDVKSQLSSTMSQNNVSASDLSSLSHVCGWDLVASHILSGDNDDTYPTHDLVMNHGQLDYWESGSEKLNVVLRADYVCLSAEYDNDDQLQSSTWGWKIPLGEGATCSNGKTHTPNLTYGGNEVVFEIDQGNPGGAEDVFKDGCIWHGADTVSVGQQVSPETVYINLHWDYQSKCVIGELSDTPDQGSYTQDGILHRSIYVAKCAPFTPSTMAKVGDLADGELVEHGTFGDFTQDGPKMDSYCQHDSNVRFQSIEWDNLGGQVVNCQVQQLHGFSDLDNNTDADEEDQLVVRRKDDDGGAEIRYVDLSSVVSSLLSADVQTDTDSPNSDLSSIQWTDDDSGNPVLQLFKFDDHEAVDAQDSDEVVVKRGDGVEYVQLSTIVVSGDTNQGNIGKSIETTEDGNGNKYHQLYKFDGGGLPDTIQVGVQLNGNAESLVPDEYEFVLRKNGASGEIEYAKIELSAFDAELSADSDVGEQKSIDIDNDVIQLHDMDEAGEDLSAFVPHCFAEPQDPLSSLSAEFVVRKGGAGGEIGYVALELLQDKTPLDRNTYYTQKSLQYATIDNVSFLELNGFHSDATSDVPVAVLSSDAKPLLPANWQFLTRHKDQAGYWQIGYTTLSAMVSGALSVNVDSDVIAQKSLEWAEDDGQEYLQLYGMDAAGEATEQVDLKNAKDAYQDLLPDDEEFVIRSAQGGQIKYKNVGVLLSAYNGGGGGGAEISVDSEIPALQHSSLQHISQGGNDYYELYGFHDPTNTQTNLAGYEYVVRHNDGNGNVSVKYLSADLDATACPASFDYYTRPDGTHWLRGGYFQQARRFYWVSSTEITVPGMIQLSVSMEYTSRSGIIQGASSLPSPTVSAMYIPLWEIGQDMKPTYDYRHAPMLPRWE